MRMTRAALRAQEAEDDLQTKIESKLKEQGLVSSQDDVFGIPTLIHEDSLDASRFEATNTEYQDTGRLALRDITSENYPVADSMDVEENEGGEMLTKAIKKAKSKKGKKTSAKKKDVVIDEQEVTEPAIQTDEQETDHSQSTPDVTLKADTTESDEPSSTVSFTQEISDQQPLPTFEMEDAPHTELTQQDVSEGTSVREEADGSENHEEQPPLTPQIKSTETASKTPHFNPDVHLPAQTSASVPSDEVEDSFVDSIKSRSPSKFSHPVAGSIDSQAIVSHVGTPVKHTPQRKQSLLPSPGSQRSEDSIEAIDALEEAIEKFNQDLPEVEPLLFDSPVRTRRTPARTPAKVLTKTPAKTPSKSPAKGLSKTPAKSLEKTPARMSSKTLAKTPAKTPARTPAKPNTVTPKPRTPSIDTGKKKTSPIVTQKMASAKLETVRERVKAIESVPVATAHRRATSVHVLKKEAPEVKTTLKSRHVATKSVPAIAALTTASMSFSNSPHKQAASQPKKRVTSSGVLSTAKPGFVPAKSSKPVTTANFTLPGEAIAARLKAQREERSKHDEVEVEKKPSFKARPMPAQAARPSIMPRENKASVARTGVRQASGENKENVEPRRPIARAPSTSASKSNTKSVAANSSVRRTTIAPKPASTIGSRKSIAPTSAVPQQRIASLTSGQQITLTKSEAVQQKLKGKEVYGRIKGSIQQQEEEKRAKEEAAKQARAEAAERGRQASREWAEKQKKKAAAGVKPAMVEAAS